MPAIGAGLARGWVLREGPILRPSTAPRLILSLVEGEARRAQGEEAQDEAKTRFLMLSLSKYELVEA